MAPTVVLPLPDTPATITIIEYESSHAVRCSADSEAFESPLRKSGWILG